TPAFPVNAQPGEEPVKPRLIWARRHRPADEQSRNQRQPKGLGGADRNSPRRARSSVPLGPDRVSATRHAKMSRDIDMSESRKISMRMIWQPIRILQRRARLIAAIYAGLARAS